MSRSNWTTFVGGLERSSSAEKVEWWTICRCFQMWVSACCLYSRGPWSQPVAARLLTHLGTPYRTVNLCASTKRSAGGASSRSYKSVRLSDGSAGLVHHVEQSVHVAEFPSTQSRCRKYGLALRSRGSGHLIAGAISSFGTVRFRRPRARTGGGPLRLGFATPAGTSRG